MFCWVLVCLLIAGCDAGDRQNDTVSVIRSVTLDARNEPSAAMLPKLKESGLTHITLVQFGFQRDADIPEIRMNPDARWYSESDRAARTLSQKADSLGMGIILKPHLWLGRYSTEGQSRSSIGYSEEHDWQTWETQYTKLIMHYAHLAEEIDAAMLVVGTELARSAHERPDYWRGLIKDVRSVYQGDLTYAANWWEEYEEIEFWDMLDYIGVQAYFELTDEPNPTNVMLAEGWEPHIEALAGLSKRMNRPILFTEIGYRNVPDAAAKPWRWPSRGEADLVDPHDDLQARLYEVFFDELWDKPWFSGAILWKWYGDRDRPRTYLDFTPQGKPAEEVIRSRFTASL